MSQTAETVFQSFAKLPSTERAKFYALLGEVNVSREDSTYEKVFGHLAESELTTQDAADYLGVSRATFGRYVQAGKIRACSEVGRSHLFSANDLRALKQALQSLKR